MLRIFTYFFTAIFLLSFLSGCATEPADEAVEDAPTPDANVNEVQEPLPLVEAEPEEQQAEVEVSPFNMLTATVTEITDGDTIKVSIESEGEETIRLIGVDTPESTREVEHYGKEAAQFTQKNLEGKTVFLELDVNERDRFGRLLAYVWLEIPLSDTEDEIRAKMFNAQLLLEGYAQVMTIAPNVKYADIFLTFEREGRNADRGLWAYVPSTDTANQGVFISHVDLANETVVIENPTSEDVDLSFWILQSERGNQTFEFPEKTILAANGNITVMSGPRAQAATGVLVWTDKNIWNNDGDPAVLHTSEGVEVSRLD